MVGYWESTKGSKRKCLSIVIFLFFLTMGKGEEKALRFKEGKGELSNDFPYHFFSWMMIFFLSGQTELSLGKISTML